MGNITLWAFIAVVLSFLIASIMGKKLIPYLHKLKYGQTILDIGPKWHKNKQGTPTMGGIMFIVSTVLVTSVVLVLYRFMSDSLFSTDNLNAMRVFIPAGLFMAVLYGAIGFIDDYIKVIKKRNLGLTAKQKLGLQFSVALAYLATLTFCGYGTETYVPFVGMVDLGVFYYIIAAVVIVGMVNAVNLTDGIDGLDGSITFFVSLFFMIIAGYMNLGGVSIEAAALAGGCLGFLVWNFHPAKVFMGDTGSLFLGGMVCALAFAVKMPIIMLPMGIMYLVEMFSVMLQVTYFKLTHGKRLFKMSPIHHHFEMCGWSETKIVIVFSLVTIIFGVISFLCVING